LSAQERVLRGSCREPRLQGCVGGQRLWRKRVIVVRSTGELPGAKGSQSKSEMARSSGSSAATVRPNSQSRGLSMAFVGCLTVRSRPKSRLTVRINDPSRDPSLSWPPCNDAAVLLKAACHSPSFPRSCLYRSPPSGCGCPGTLRRLGR
jgi:hypothetical protein